MKLPPVRVEPTTLIITRLEAYFFADCDKLVDKSLTPFLSLALLILEMIQLQM